MLGNFSIGDYFKQGAVEFAWELSLDGLRLPTRSDIWITVFGGDDELGLGPDEEAIEAWRAWACRASASSPGPRRTTSGRPARPARAGRARSSTSTAGSSSASEDDRPGDDTERFLEYWNLVFMQYDQEPADKLTPLPAKNIDTGLGLNRMAAVLQDVPSVYETDQFRPLIAAGRGAVGPPREARSSRSTRALRILADHSRATTFLIADGVVPSNEDRGYILRRVMRRAIQQGRVLGMAPGLPGPLRGRGHRDHGRGLPRAARAARRGRSAGLSAEEEALRPHARAGHSGCWTT